jgi:hypothetical protein
MEKIIEDRKVKASKGMPVNISTTFSRLTEWLTFFTLIKVFALKKNERS